MAKFNLSEAASAILEGSKETFDANIASKKAQRGNEDTQGKMNGMVGQDRITSKTAYGTNDAGKIGDSPERALTDDNPDYTKGTPSATPPGATPPVGSQKDGVGASKFEGQPQQTMGRSDVAYPVKSDATPYEAIRDRIMGKLAPQMMQSNPGATFQSYGEDIDALMQGENLSEEFKTKATTIYEAAVLSRVEVIVEDIEKQLTEQFDAAVEQVKEDLADKVNDYLNYVAQEWMEENSLAVETGLRAELTEDFIKGLHDLFVEHNINIPEEKVDIVEELIAKVEELENSLNEEINHSVELVKELNEQKKVEAIYTACEGLTQTQVEKLKSLAESMEFTTEEEFVEKVETLKESYFKTDVKFADNNALDDEVHFEEDKNSKKSRIGDVLIEQYAKTISQTVNK
jgi:hypothetical protein